MANTILNFHFDYRHPSLRSIWRKILFYQSNIFAACQPKQMIQIVANKLPDPPLYNRPAHPDCHLQILFYWTVLFAICRPFSLSGSFATGWPMWYDIPLHCCFMSAATFCKKKVWSLQPIKPTCWPESGHQMCVLPICPAMSIRAAVGEFRCCYCRYLILQHYLVGCWLIWFSVKLNR